MTLTALTDSRVQHFDQDFVVSRRRDGIVVVKFNGSALFPDYCSSLRLWNVFFGHPRSMMLRSSEPSNQASNGNLNGPTVATISSRRLGQSLIYAFIKHLPMKETKNLGLIILNGIPGLVEAKVGGTDHELSQHYGHFLFSAVVASNGT